MATLTSILASDIVSSTRSTINTNFQNLNAQTRIIYKTGDQSILSSILTADTELTFPIGVNEAWNVRLLLPFNSKAVPDFKYTFLAPAGTVGYFQDDDANQGAQNPSTIAFMAGATNDQIAGINGIFINNSVVGNISFYWAQDTNAASSVTTVYKGANIIATKLN